MEATVHDALWSSSGSMLGEDSDDDSDSRGAGVNEHKTHNLKL